jgi:hypothetical protein
LVDMHLAFSLSWHGLLLVAVGKGSGMLGLWQTEIVQSEMDSLV